MVFPWKEVITRAGITIYTDPPWIPWYQKYRVDRKIWDDAYHNIEEKDLRGLKKLG